MKFLTALSQCLCSLQKYFRLEKNIVGLKNFFLTETNSTAIIPHCND
ncbi:MAG: hypothetical protein IJU91_00520 [Selenomonadaceae bacterium]|nr:hypothetical protein [Selenomonadaceae bacterium]